MSRDDRAILLNTQLLALYLQVSDPSVAHNDDDAIAQVLSVRDAVNPHDHPSLGPVFDRYAALIGLHLAGPSRARLDSALAEGRNRTPALPEIPPAFEGHLRDLAQLKPEGRPGISLVTCSMNRTQNLIKALPSWLANREISEVVIVDWSSDTPVDAELLAAGIADPRIRILRVEDEARWVLSYAFNAGFRAAACNLILKVDADIVLSTDFFRRNHLLPGTFIAGNWRTATDDQAHVNGFFFISRRALHAVGGFNEHITSYGWDDDDIYDRLTLSGYRRQDVAPGTIFHLPHDDAERTGETAVSADQVTLGHDLKSGTSYLIRRNRYIAMVMPHWDDTAITLPFRLLTRTDTAMAVQREGWVPSRVPAHVVDAANSHALTELTAWRLGKRVLDLTPDRIALLLDRPRDDVSRIDVEIALAAPDHILPGPGHYLVLDLPGGILDAAPRPPRLDQAFRRLVALAKARGLHPVLRAPHVDLPLGAPACLRLIPLIPSWEPIGEVPAVTLDLLLATPAPAATHLRLDLTPEAIAQAALAAPDLSLPRPRIFIDAQHGLGNRLRALASAAAIADATDRELVVVWQPDDHCNGHLSDLFTYDGAVLDTRFADTAAEQGCVVYNYMSNEPGAWKDAPIRLDTDRDIYARAASVLKSPASIWEAENRFLQSLTPIDPVRALVSTVRHPNDLSAHVRMEGGKKSEHLAYENAENWLPDEHALIDEWRAKSHFSGFLNRIDALFAAGRAERIFLAADLPETYAEFQHHYGDRLAWLPRSLYDRSAEQLHYALADAILLSRSPLLLGSTWSSFSELAMRLAPEKIVIEMSGKDF